MTPFSQAGNHLSREAVFHPGTLPALLP